MTRLRNALVGLLLAAVVLTGMLHLLDWAFVRYENARLVTHASVSAGRYLPISLRYNYHGGEITRKKKPGEYRILFFGDSYTHGVTTPPYTLPADLEAILNRSSPARPR